MGRRPLPENEQMERRRIGATLRALRELARQSPDDFASSIGISRPYLANIEAGRKPLTHSLLLTIAKALGVPTTAIARDDYFAEVAA